MSSKSDNQQHASAVSLRIELTLKDMNRQFVGKSVIQTNPVADHADYRLSLMMDDNCAEKFKFKSAAKLTREATAKAEVFDVQHKQLTLKNEPVSTGILMPLHLQDALNINLENPKKVTLAKCPVCQCRDLFIRKDFPQKLGLSLVIATGLIATYLAFTQGALVAFIVLFAMAIIDACIYLFTGQVTVCYRCRSEFRGIDAVNPEGFELATAEKYRN